MCSAALIVLERGAFTTITPRRVAASTSTLSTPMPARATTLRRGRLQHVGRHAGRAPDHERVVGADLSGKVAAREVLAHVDLEPFAEQLETSLGELLGDEDPHLARRLLEDALRRGHGRPRFTGWPRRSRVISRAARPRMMSSSLKYPKCPIRKTFPFSGPCPGAITHGSPRGSGR